MVKKHMLTSIVFIGLLIMGSSLVVFHRQRPGPASLLFRSAFMPKMPSPFSSRPSRTCSTHACPLKTAPSPWKKGKPLQRRISRGRHRHGPAAKRGLCLFGSITMLGTMVSTDAQFFDVVLEKPLLTFNEVGQDQGDIIAHMEHLTTRINETVFGDAKAVAAPPVSGIRSGARRYSHPSGKTGDSRPGAQNTAAPSSAATAPSAALAPPSAPHRRGTNGTNDALCSRRGCSPPPDKGEVSLSYWKSESFPEAVEGISIADVDGDGSNEVVFTATTRFLSTDMERGPSGSQNLQRQILQPHHPCGLGRHQPQRHG